MGLPPPGVQTAPRRTFEALFRPEGVPVTEALARDLLALGVDLTALAPSYPLAVLRRCFDVARRHAFGSLPEADGFRALGRAFVAGFKQTPIGWVFRSMAPVFGPDRTIQTLPRYLTSVRSDVPLEVVAVGERHYHLTSGDVDANPHFLAGCLEAVLEAAGAQGGQVVVTQAERDGYTIDLVWAG